MIWRPDVKEVHAGKTKDTLEGNANFLDRNNDAVQLFNGGRVNFPPVGEHDEGG